MDQLAASPVTNDYALLLSKILRGAKDVGNRIDLPVLGGVGDMLLGKAPEEVENWAYGNMPINMPPEGTGARIPQVKSNRKEGLADALLAAPVGGMGGPGKAMIPNAGHPALGGDRSKDMRLMVEALRRRGIPSIEYDSYDDAMTKAMEIQKKAKF